MVCIQCIGFLEREKSRGRTFSVEEKSTYKALTAQKNMAFSSKEKEFRVAAVIQDLNKQAHQETRDVGG